MVAKQEGGINWKEPAFLVSVGAGLLVLGVQALRVGLISLPMTFRRTVVR